MQAYGSALLIAVLLLAGSVSACTYENDGAPLDVTTSTLQVLSRVPAPADRDVPIDQTITLRFSAPVDAHLIDSTDLRLFTGVLEIPGTLHVDHLERTLSFSPVENLRANLQHQVVLRRGIRAHDGSSLPAVQVYDFMTGSRVTPDKSSQPSVSDEAAQSLFNLHCGRCHGGRAPPAGVDLTSLDAAQRTMVGVTSDAGALRVVPGDHARSYLILKIEALFAFIGLPMPPDRALLSPEELRLVADWIDGQGGKSPLDN
ncbi:MAG: Ig-like domain-containing protein [Deltaproteobacteria bacterium]|nr:Ig-like domain-containing protein [Deltaproteobacteria bacterium]